VIIASETGSGKTLVFLMAVFMKAIPAAAEAEPTGVRALVIVPNGHRDLVDQHAATFRRVAQRLKATGDPFWGGVANTDEAVSCTTWQSGGGKVDRRSDDRRNEFPKALIRIDTADRILVTARLKNKPEEFFRKVSVIAIDEVDKFVPEETKESDDQLNVQTIAKMCSLSQIICASATVVREAALQKGAQDLVANWLRTRLRTNHPDTGRARPLYSVQTKNVMPGSVFHLIIDLRDASRKEEIQLACERLLTCRDDAVFDRGTERIPTACLSLYNVNRSMEEKRRGIESSFTDKKSAGLKPELAHLVRTMAYSQRSDRMKKLLEGNLTGLIGTDALSTGLDFPFSSVSFSRPAIGLSHFYSVFEYIHASGRCGRRPNQLGVSIMYIHNEEDAQKWEKLFQGLLSLQSDLCGRVGVVRVGDPPPVLDNFKSFFQGFFGPLPVRKPSESNFSIRNNLTDHQSRMSSVLKLFATRNDLSLGEWPRDGPASVPRASIPSTAPPVATARPVPTSEMQVYFGPWSAPDPEKGSCSPLTPWKQTFPSNS